MSPELDKQLCNKYPEIFIDRNKSPQETCMHWGFEVGDGWYELIDVLCEALTYTFTTSVQVDEEDGKRLGIEPYKDAKEEVNYFFRVEPPQVVADQVKEKFGTLRFYYHLEFSEDNKSLVATKKYPQLVEINKRYSDYIDGIVHFAEIASGRTCEVTGAEGSRHVRGGWYKTLNENVAKTEQFKGYNKLDSTQ
ncbi:MAG: hypothetical protein EBR30_01280 [Cytophagia bacterium]|nr:hypothetical protein [Cytophagia bacterium]NBW33668.1 hypothetical protein [Cytophagia bacterium]